MSLYYCFQVTTKSSFYKWADTDRRAMQDDLLDFMARHREDVERVESGCCNATSTLEALYNMALGNWNVDHIDSYNTPEGVLVAALEDYLKGTECCKTPDYDTRIESHPCPTKCTGIFCAVHKLWQEIKGEEESTKW